MAQAALLPRATAPTHRSKVLRPRCAERWTARLAAPHADGKDLATCQSASQRRSITVQTCWCCCYRRRRRRCRRQQFQPRLGVPSLQGTWAPPCSKHRGEKSEGAPRQALSCWVVEGEHSCTGAQEGKVVTTRGKRESQLRGSSPWSCLQAGSSSTRARDPGHRVCAQRQPFPS